MFTTKKNIEQAIETVKTEAIEFESNGGKLQYNNMIAIVYVVQVSPRKYCIGWNFARKGATVGDSHSYDTGCGYIAGEIVHIF